MVKTIGIVIVVGVAAFLPTARGDAQQFSFGSGGVGVHFGDDDYDDHYGHYGHDDDYWDDHHSHYHNSYYHDSDWDDSSWLFVVPQFGNSYRGTYYSDRGNYYYRPQANRAYRAAQPVEIEFGGFAHIDDLSGRLQQLANQLCLDMHYNYRHNADFADTYHTAYKILETAKYIHAKEHQGDRDELALRLGWLDASYHEIESAVKSWSRRSNRQIGQGGVQDKLETLGATLHHLMHDVGVTGDHSEAASDENVEEAPLPLPVAEPVPAN